VLTLASPRVAVVVTLLAAAGGGVIGAFVASQNPAEDDRHRQ